MQKGEQQKSMGHDVGLWKKRLFSLSYACADDVVLKSSMVSVCCVLCGMSSCGLINSWKSLFCRDILSGPCLLKLLLKILLKRSKEDEDDSVKFKFEFESEGVEEFEELNDEK